MSVAIDALVEVLQSRFWSSEGEGTEIVETLPDTSPRELAIEVTAILGSRIAECMKRIYENGPALSSFHQLERIDDFTEEDLVQFEGVLVASGILLPRLPVPPEAVPS